MAFMITKDCILCGACVVVCPVDAVSEGKDIYRIDPARCSECLPVYNSAQCAGVCPVNACIANPGFPESEETLKEKYRHYIENRIQ